MFFTSSYSVFYQIYYVSYEAYMNSTPYWYKRNSDFCVVWIPLY